MPSSSAPEIPGYRLLSELGRGGMATVYLAVQISVDREVALKVMSPALLADPNYGVRFLREARIAAKLHHRHVVGVHDVGRHDDLHYIAMEYLPAGPILGPDAPARDILFALRVIRETASALDYAHSKGFVHRDVKPDNILLRQDGSSVLTDFGIARANDSLTRMTRTGAVIGTPYYMSPEQARGRPLDGRADLYSLGVVLYELLVGRVPFQAPEALAVALKHVTEPVPELPEPLASLQPLVDRVLAKQPDARFQTGADLVHAIEEIEFAIARDELPDLIIPDESFRRQLLMAETRSGLTRHPTPGTQGRQDYFAEPSLSAVRERAEPSLGSLDDVVAEAGRLLGTSAEHTGPSRIPVMTPDQPMAPRRRRRKRSLAPWLVLLMLAALAAAAWHWRDALLEHLPDPRGEDLLVRAERALQAGQLEGEQGAERLLQQAQGSDYSDSERVTAAMSALADAWLERAQRSWRSGDVAAASDALQRFDALAAYGNRERAAALREQIATGRDEAQRLESLLRDARQAAEDGIVDGASGADALYRQALELAPDNALALAGLQRITEQLLTQAETAIAEEDFELAEQRLADVARRSGSSARLGELQGLLAQARSAEVSRVQTLRDDATRFLRMGQLISPPGENALARYETLLRLNPEDRDAQRGRVQVADALLAQAGQALDARDASEARRLMAAAERIQGRSAAALQSLRSRLDSLDRELERERSVAALSQADQERISAALQRSRQALEAGRYIDPPGENAYGHMRTALAISAFHPEVLAHRRQSGEWLRSQASTALDSASFDRAHELYDAAELFQPGHPANLALRGTLVSSLQRAAEQALDEGDRAAAEPLIGRLDLLDRGSDALSELRRRLRQAP